MEKLGRKLRWKGSIADLDEAGRFGDRALKCSGPQHPVWRGVKEGRYMYKGIWPSSNQIAVR